MRLSADEATITVSEAYGRLCVRWTVRDSFVFNDIKSSFRSAFGRHSQATWNGTLKAWTLPQREYDALSWWVAQTFQREAVSWLNEDSDADPAAHQRGRRARAHHAGTEHSESGLRTAYQRLYLREDAPLWACEAVYRAAQKHLHPDAGGNHEAAVAVNGAIVAIREAQHARAP